ncbi:hypothetical protein BC937DRAFT_91410 [Endogone sp. FLAS-F59071]|nr:hypothetical protein BC937DRAFT_91410 [Endogone sp. FLAS-F59071]|eukprot:RUS16284.1 hypothetical protein BC937DRAFT_91410 [Endogone sp. FLAS-F59071]
MEWESATPCLKHEGNNSPPNYDQAPQPINVEFYERKVQVPLAIAKLLNPIIHREIIPADPNKLKPATTRIQEELEPDTAQTSYGYQVAFANQVDWKSSVAIVHDEPISPEYTTVNTKQNTAPKKDVPTLPPLYTMVSSTHITNGLQDNYIDSAPKYKRKRPKVKWTKQEELLLKKGLDEGLGWQAISRKYLPTRDRSGCYLHWQAMQAKALPHRRGWRRDENEKLAVAMKGRSKEMKALWLKIANDIGKGRTWKEVEIQHAFLTAKKDKSKAMFKAKL